MIALRDFESCAFCPKLCRHVCPVAVGTGREAATPTAMRTGPWAWLQGHGVESLALRSAQLCVDCGACSRACKLQRPVGELLRNVRAQLGGPPSVEALAPIEGIGEYVAVHSDSRDWAAALEAQLDRPVAQVRTSDQLGAAVLDVPSVAETHLAKVRAHFAGRTLVLTDRGSWAVAQAAGLQALHLAELISPLDDHAVHHPCSGPRLAGVPASNTLACCGAHPGLVQNRPDLAEEMGRAQAQRLGTGPVSSSDSACATHLRACGASVTDPVSWLLGA